MNEKKIYKENELIAKFRGTQKKSMGIIGYLNVKSLKKGLAGYTIKHYSIRMK